MSTWFGVRKALFLAPLLAGLAAITAMAYSRDAAATGTDAAATEDAAQAIDEAALEALELDAALAPAGNCTYYSNASFTTVVGRFGYDCCNNPIAWGRKTRYYLCGGCFPCIPPPQ